MNGENRPMYNKLNAYVSLVTLLVMRGCGGYYNHIFCYRILLNFSIKRKHLPLYMAVFKKALSAWGIVWPPFKMSEQ